VHDGGQGRRREHDGDRPSQQRGHHRLRELQAHELRARGADGAAHGEIALARLDPYHEQVRHVDAGDEEHDGRGREEDPERPRGGAEHLVEQRTNDGAVLLDDAGVSGRTPEALGQAAGQRRQLRRRRFPAHAGRQPTDHGVAEPSRTQALGADVVHDPEQRAVVRKPELRAHHADDRPPRARDVVGTAHHGGVGPEPGAPQGVADHDHPRLVCGHGKPSERGLGAQRRVQRVRDGRHRDPLDAVTVAERVREAAEGRHVLDEARGFLVLEIELARGAELPRHLRARGLAGDEHEPFRVGVGQGRDQHVVDDGEDARQRADGEAEGGHGGGGEAGRPAKGAEGVAQLRVPSAERGPRGSSRLERDPRPGRPQPLGQRGAGDVEGGGEGGAQPGRPAAPAIALAVEQGMLDDGGAEALAERRREQPDQDAKQGPHDRPRARPRRSSATAAVCFSRLASSASRRRPAAVSA
jgi:hypothetical protein